MRLMIFASTKLIETSVYEALDTDHHGHPLREAGKQTVSKYRERYPVKLGSQIGCLHCFKAQHQCWVNGTLAVVTSLHPSCIVLAKLANSAHR